MIRDRFELEYDRARIRFVGQQKVCQLRQVGAGVVAAEIGHRDVRELEQELEGSVLFGIATNGQLPHQLDRRTHALEASSHVEKPPAEIAGHVFHDHP